MTTITGPVLKPDNVTIWTGLLIAFHARPGDYGASSVLPEPLVKTRTDSLGAFSVDLPAGEYVVSYPEYSESYFEAQTAPETRFSITVPASGPVSLQVLRNQTLQQAGGYVTRAALGADVAAATDAAIGGGWGHTVAITGDSKAAGAADAVNRSYFRAWGIWTGVAANGKIDMPHIWGHGGWTSAQLLDVFDAEILSLNPDVVIEDMGTNDSLDGNNSAAGTIANIAEIHRRTRAAGAALVMTTLTPSGCPAVPTPAAPTVVVEATGGTIGASSPQYKVVWANALGATLPSPAATATVSSGTTNAVVIEVPYRDDVIGWDLYKSTDGGTTFLRLAQVRGSGGQGRYACWYRDTGSGTPAGSPPASNTTAKAMLAADRRKILTINAAKRAYAEANGVLLVDLYRVVVDPLTGAWAAGLTVDGTHPSSLACKLLGEAVWAAIASRIRPRVTMGSWDNADPLNLVPDNSGNPNGLLLTNDGTVPSGMGDYGGSTSGLTRTTGTRSGHTGAAFAVTRTAHEPRYCGLPAKAVTPGRVIQAAITIEMVGAGAIGVVKWGYNPANLHWRYTFDQPIGPTRIQTPPVVVPAGVTAIYAEVDLGSEAPGTIAVSDLVIYDVTP